MKSINRREFCKISSAAGLLFTLGPVCKLVDQVSSPVQIPEQESNRDKDTFSSPGFPPSDREYTEPRKVGFPGSDREFRDKDQWQSSRLVHPNGGETRVIVTCSEGSRAAIVVEVDGQKYLNPAVVSGHEGNFSVNAGCFGKQSDTQDWAEKMNIGVFDQPKKVHFDGIKRQVRVSLPRIVE